jgi:hypothetical protein
MGETYCSHGEVRNAYKILVGKRNRKRPLRIPRRRCEDNINIDLQEINYEGVYWITLAQDKFRRILFHRMSHLLSTTHTVLQFMFNFFDFIKNDSYYT